MIHLQMRGFIADNLFQYVVARILAEDLGYALDVTHATLHPRENVPRLLELLSQFRDAPLTFPGKVFHHPVDSTAVIGHGDFDGYDLDLAGMTSRLDARKIMVEGYFQRYELLRPYKTRIRSWFEIEPCYFGHDISADDIVIHIRHGDFVVFGLAISLGFYTDLLDRLAFRKLFICGYGLSEEVRRVFARYDPTYVHGAPVDDFRFMKGFDRMIQSNSGFSWWAGFLSQAREIHAPVMASNTRQIDLKSEFGDLRVDDEERYHYVYDVPYLERSYTVRDIVASLGQLGKRRVVHSLKRLVIDRWRGMRP